MVTHFNRYQLLCGHDASVDPVLEPAPPALAPPPAPPPAPAPPDPPPLPAILPKGFVMTAEQVNELSGTRKIMRRREYRLRQRANKDVSAALEGLSEKQQALKTAQSTQEIEQAHTHHRKVRKTLKSFESSTARLKDLRHQRIQTKRVWSKLAASERAHVRHHHVLQKEHEHEQELIQGHDRKEHEHEHEQATGDITVFLYGAAGTGVGSRIRGHSRRGGKKVREQHMQHAPVALTNEWRTSQTCGTCFGQLSLARARRIIRGKIKTVRLHGAVHCTNRRCPLVARGWTIQPRDTNAALCIAMSGTSRFLLPEPLPPFTRALRPRPMYTSDNILEPNSYTPSTSGQMDAMGAPVGPRVT
ncbi:hypothetical protein BGZ70_003529 [Mortierella alpina]|uniref:Uncharacterized protein n=1 Tax=Mortierella alpina TaxID=64518 RepID=A0A9P6JAG5_MORAP|nr:hypothetical protein BGZ70_003529 [Mortierella alpina]